ncbi:putative cGMP-dependent protein kinase, partial [Daphnia magna]
CQRLRISKKRRSSRSPTSSMSATTIEAACIFARSCSWEPPCRVRSVIYASPHNPNMKQTKKQRISLEMYR